MSETRFTPGPWVASRFGCQVLTGDSWSSICELKGDARWEDGRGSFPKEYEWEIQEANSRIIAAAPEMHDALAPFADIDGEGDEDFPDDTPVTVKFGRTTDYTLTLGDFRRARHVLSKARGERP